MTIRLTAGLGALLCGLTLVLPAQAVIIATDTFNTYNVGPLNPGNNGGTGWGGEWGPPAATTTTVDVIDTAANPLDATVGGGSMVINGGSRAMKVTQTTGNTIAAPRAFATPLTQTFYAGFLLRYENSAAGSFGNDNTFSLHFANNNSNTNTFNVGMRASINTAQASNTNHFMVRHTTAPASVAQPTQATGGLAVTGQDYFMVARLNYSASNTFDSIDAWLDPSANDNLGSPDMTFSIAAGTGVGSISHLFFRQAANQSDDVYLADELVVATTWADIVGVSTPQPTLNVNRATGAVSLTNTSGSSVQITGYTLGSTAGSLDPVGWTELSNSNAGWSTTASTTTALGETTAGVGVSLADMGTPISLGAAYKPSPFADLQFQYRLSGGSLQAGSINYTGAAPTIGDLSLNGTIDRADFVILSDNSYKDLSSLTDTAAYYSGDLDLDGDNDFDDFAYFRQIYTDANGALAWNELIAGASVPEPTTAVLAAVVGLGVFYLRRTR